MDAPDPALQRFLPLFLRRRLAAEAHAGVGFDGKPKAWSFGGALLFVDMIGFTAEVERLAAAGPDGPDRASELVEHSLGTLVAALEQAGGDVVVFAGDGLFVLWPQSESESETDLADAVTRAANAALDALAGHARAQASAPRLRFSLGAGAFTAHCLGGHRDRWHCLLSGPAFEQVGRVDRLGVADAVAASLEAVNAAAGRIEVSAAPNGRLIVRRARRDPPTAAVPAVTGLPPQQVRAFLPDPVLGNLGRLGSRWLAELRRPTVIFARLAGLLDGGDLDRDRAQQATRQVQMVVDRFEGSILQFVVDDKGPVLVIAFGLAARVHEDDPARAAQAALDLVEALGTLGIACGLGLATGRLFCGLIGSDTRATYTLLGQTMNLAARLMQRAAPGPLADEHTCQLSRRRVEYVREGLLRVKGIDAELPHFRAVRARPGEGPATTLEPPLVGRAAEVRLLEAALEGLRARQRCGPVALVGEAGIGKSRLLRELQRRAQGHGLQARTVMTGAVDSGLFAGWRPLLRALAASDPAAATAGGDRAFLHAFLGEPVTELPEADDAERAFRTREAIIDLVLNAARRTPLLLCVEDTHWMDSLSWSLLAWLAQRAADTSSPLLIVLTSRELEARAPAPALARLSDAGLVRVPLLPLEDAERMAVACAVLEVHSLSRPLGRWIAARSGGNPLFCRELAVAAMESGRIQVADGHADLDLEHWQMTPSVQLPDTLQGLIASRLDRLDAAGQLVLRVAAVIGNRFGFAALQALLPEEAGDASRKLGEVRDAGFLEQEGGEHGASFVFRHALVRDAAYDSLPYRYRRELHARLARWLQDSDEATPAALLAHHWELAENWEDAYPARIRAGEMALQDYSNREAIEHYTAAVKIRSQAPELCARIAATGPDLGLARALHRMGDERGSRRHIEDALRAAGEFLPSSPFGRIAAIGAELAWRLLPAPLRRLRERRARHRLRDRVAAYDELPEILYYDNDPPALAHAILRFLHLAEAERRHSAEYARAQAWFALLRSGIGGLAPAERGFASALQTAQAAGDPTVEAWVRLARGSTLAQFGQWQAAEHWLLDARARCVAMGDRTRWWNVTSGLAHVLSYRGELQAAADLLDEAIQVNRDTDNPLFLCWGLSGHADILHRLGEGGADSRVVRLLRRAREALALRPDPAADLFSRGVLAAALQRADCAEQAWDLARDTVEHTLRSAPMVWLQVSSYLGLEYVLSRNAALPSRRGEALRLMRRIERSLRAFARLVPIARPALALLRGSIESVRGRPQRARRQFETGLVVARRLDLSLEAGKLHLALAELGADDAAAQRHRAAALFARIGARHHHQVAAREPGEPGEPAPKG